jgi:hypothetical protein
MSLARLHLQHMHLIDKATGKPRGALIYSTDSLSINGLIAISDANNDDYCGVLLSKLSKSIS